MSTKTKKYPPLKKRHSELLNVHFYWPFEALQTYGCIILLTIFLAKPCKYFQFGLCTNTAEECNFAHVSVVPNLTIPLSMQGPQGSGCGHGECIRQSLVYYR